MTDKQFLIQLRNRLCSLPPKEHMWSKEHYEQLNVIYKDLNLYIQEAEEKAGINPPKKTYKRRKLKA